MSYLPKNNNLIVINVPTTVELEDWVNNICINSSRKDMMSWSGQDRTISVMTNLPSTANFLSFTYGQHIKK